VPRLRRTLNTNTHTHTHTHTHPHPCSPLLTTTHLRLTSAHLCSPTPRSSTPVVLSVVLGRWTILAVRFSRRSTSDENDQGFRTGSRRPEWAPSIGIRSSNHLPWFYSQCYCKDRTGILPCDSCLTWLSVANFYLLISLSHASVLPVHLDYSICI